MLESSPSNNGVTRSGSPQWDFTFVSVAADLSLMLVPLGGATPSVEPFYAPAVAFGDGPRLACQRWLWPFQACDLGT